METTTTTFSQDFPLNILIAENNPEARAATKDALSLLGYQPEVAADGQEVLTKTSYKTYDVILMDMQLPKAEDMLVARMCALQPRRPLIIAMTDSGLKDYRQLCLQAGMDHSIRKPVDMQELTLQLKACSVLAGVRRIRS